MMSEDQEQPKRNKISERMEQTDVASREVILSEKLAVQKKMEHLRNLRLSREPVVAAPEEAERKPRAKKNPHWK